MPWQTMPRARVAVTLGSFWRSDPAAELRGLANMLLAGLEQRLVETLEGLDRQEHLAAHLDQLGAGNSLLVLSRCGTESIVLTLGVTSSPVRPSPRVSARTRRPVLVEQVDREPVDLELAGGRPGRRCRRVEPRAPTSRAPRRRRRCRGSPSARGGRPAVNSVETAPPTFWVGESGVRRSGTSSSSASSRRIFSSKSASSASGRRARSSASARPRSPRRAPGAPGAARRPDRSPG